MDTETMIKNLEKVEDDHKNDKLFTGQLNIADMARDVRKRLEELKPYEDTGLTPERIMELKERDTAREPRMIYENNCLKAYTCPNCNLTLIYKDASGWNGKYCSYCSGCGQRLKWEE